MWILILVYVGITGCASSVLQGPHICPEEERYMVNVTRNVLKKIKIRHYKWCMNVPPRCSYYTDGEQFLPQVQEQEFTRMVNKCCPEFVADNKGEKCIPKCYFGCVHGVCSNDTNKCICHAGFWGDNCDNECQSGRWGRNCEFVCSCEKGDCDPITGYCICPPGWKGNRCQESVIDAATTTTTQVIVDYGPTTDASTKTTSQNSYANLEERLPRIFNRTGRPTLQKYYTFYLTTQNPKHAVTQNKAENLQPPQISSATESNLPNIINIPSLMNAKISNITWLSNNESSKEMVDFNYVQQRNGQFETQQYTEVDTSVPVVHMTTSSSEQDKTKQEQEFVNTEITDQLVSVTQPSHVNLKAKVADDLEVTVTSTQVFSSDQEWLKDESRIALKNHLTIHQSQTPIKNNSHLVFSVGAAVGIVATLIAIVIAVFTAHNYRKKKYTDSKVSVNNNKSKNENGDAGVPTVSVYARSVFHAPLPEPPIFENPVFSTPLEDETKEATVETQVFCNMHLPTHSTFQRDSRIADTFYDHPPSTGSYRAASIPEHPEQNFEVVKSESREHLYDEIPYWKHPLPSADSVEITTSESHCYYANTAKDSINGVTMQQTHM